MKTYKVFQIRDGRLKDCSKCGEQDLHRSRARNAWEQIVKKYLPLNIYRCRSCGWRGTLFNFYFNRNSVKALAIYIGMAIVAAGLVRFVITKFLLK